MPRPESFPHHAALPKENETWGVLENGGSKKKIQVDCRELTTVTDHTASLINYSCWGTE